MFTVDELTAEAIRRAFHERGEFAGIARERDPSPRPWTAATDPTATDARPTGAGRSGARGSGGAGLEQAAAAAVAQCMTREEQATRRRLLDALHQAQQAVLAGPARTPVWRRRSYTTCSGCKLNGTRSASPWMR